MIGRTVRLFVFAVLAVAGLVLPFAPVAHAEGGIAVPQTYGNPRWVNTSNCPSASNCFYSDSIDGGTYFQHDEGGTGLRVYIKNGYGTVFGKMEFHPLDEIVVVCDARSDGLGVRAYTAANGDNAERHFFYGRAYNDGKCNEYDMSYYEGQKLVFNVALYEAGNEWSNYRYVRHSSETTETQFNAVA